MLPYKGKIFRSLLGLVLLLTLLSACSPQRKPEGSGTPSYTEMKSMMMDIINSEDFKNNLAKMMQQSEFQQMSIASQPQFKETVDNVMKSPQFRVIMAESLNDPDFKKGLQQSIIEVMQGPDFKRELSSLVADEVRRLGGGGGTNGGSTAGGGVNAGTTNNQNGGMTAR